MEGLLGDLEVPGHLLDRLALGQELVGLGQLSDHLFGPVTPLFHLCCPQAKGQSPSGVRRALACIEPPGVVWVCQQFHTAPGGSLHGRTRFVKQRWWSLQLEPVPAGRLGRRDDWDGARTQKVGAGVVRLAVVEDERTILAFPCSAPERCGIRFLTKDAS